MTESLSPAPPAVVSEQRAASDPAVRWLLTAVLLAVLVAWWHLSHRLTDVESNVSSSMSSSVGTSFPSTDPVQCWMFGVGITGDKAKVDALAKGDPSHDCIRYALQGARGEYLEPYPAG